MNIKRIFNLAVAVGLISALTSCAVSYPIAVTNNKSIKEGTVSQSVWFGIPPFDMDLSVKTAAENGGIKKVSTVDFLVESKLLGFQQKYTTRVTGE
ncbi:MAG: TRL domain-containing protein [Cryomorphaceae bacterium]